MTCMTSSPRTRSSSYGTVTRLPSGSYRARYRAPDGRRRSKTFSTKTDARVFLSTQQADQVRRVWRAPAPKTETVGKYAEGYLSRADLRPSTRGLYRQVWDTHLEASWAERPIQDVTPSEVRRWYDERQPQVGPTALAQSYRLLRAIFNVAVHDDLIPANPCKLKKASTAPKSRPTRALTVDEVMRLSDAVPDQYRAFVLVVAFGALRFGEATALRRSDVSEGAGVVNVSRSVRKGQEGPPKTQNGFRAVALPATVSAALAVHLRAHVAPHPDALVFGTSTGNYLATQNWSRVLKRALAEADLPEIRTHELRHTGATLAAQSGATLKELMTRLGHATPHAAMIYQHAASHRDVEIASALDRAIASAGVGTR